MLDKLKEVPNIVWLIATLILGGAFIAVLVSGRNQQVLSNVSIPIEVVEYFDYQCSHCQDLQPTMVQIEEQFGAKVEVVPKYLPIFYNAASNYQLAYGAEAARVQLGEAGFNSYVSALIDLVDQARAGEIASTAVTPANVANQIGVDISKFNTDFNSAAVRQTVDTAKVEIALEYSQIFALDSGSLSYIYGYGAEAAREQGKFMEYHNAIFDTLIAQRTQNTVAATPAAIAEELGLDMAKFNSDFASREIRERILASREEALTKGLSSTPSMFIEGQRTENIGRTVNGKSDYTPLIETVDRYVKQGEANANK